jgi:hypothetical protein
LRRTLRISAIFRRDLTDVPIFAVLPVGTMETDRPDRLEAWADTGFSDGYQEGYGNQPERAEYEASRLVAHSAGILGKNAEKSRFPAQVFRPCHGISQITPQKARACPVK